MTYTMAILEVSCSAYEEILDKLKKVYPDEYFMVDGCIDMHGIGLKKEGITDD